MDISALSFRDIQYVLAVADLEHFGRAAQACHVSQPALSAQIKKVETLLGGIIFERGPRTVKVTELGQRFLSRAKEVWVAAEGLAAVASEVAEPMTGTLRIGAIATLGPYFWPHVLGRLRRKFPRLNLILREGLTDSLIGLLRAGDLDGVLASPTFETQGLESVDLFFEPFVAALPRGHELEGKAALRARDLRADEMVLLEEGHCLKDQTLDLCPANRRGFHRQSHATSIETLRQLVAVGLGYTLLPALSVGKTAVMGELISYRPLASEKMGRQITFYYRRQSALRPDLEHFCVFLRQESERLSPHAQL